MTDPIAGRYAGTTVLVTGHTGFKGSWLCSMLIEAGARVIGLALPPTGPLPGVFELCGLEHRMHSLIGDVRSRETVETVLAEHGPEIVFHLAAQPLVRHSYVEPVETWTTNVMGTVHVLDSARRTPSVRAVVVITSDKVYENREDGRAFRESDRLGGHDPYASSKAATELAAATWRASFLGPEGRVALATARAGNAIGGGDWADDRLVPDIFRALMDDRPVVLRNPGATRPWQHVLDALYGYLMLGDALTRDAAAHAGAWNFGPLPEDVIPVGDLAERIVAGWGEGRIETVGQQDAPHESNALRLDATQARTRLGWKPRLDLARGIAVTTEWYRTFADDRDGVADCTARQVREYLAEAAS